VTPNVAAEVRCLPIQNWSSKFVVYQSQRFKISKI